MHDDLAYALALACLAARVWCEGDLILMVLTIVKNSQRNLNI